MSAETGRARRPGSTPDSDLRRLVDNLPGMAYRCRNDTDRAMLFVSGGSKALTGFDPTDLLTNRVVAYARLIHDDDRDRVRDDVQRALDDGRDFALTYRIRRADGDERWVWEQGRGVYGERGEVLYVEGYVVDITGRYELASQLADSETWNRILLDQPLVGVYVIDHQRFRYVNHRFAEIFGRAAHDLMELPSVFDVVHPEDRPLVATSLETLRTGSGTTNSLGFRAIHATGRTLYVEAHRSSVDMQGGRAIIGVLTDVTDRVEAERRAYYLQKMEAMGRLAAGIAHDFRNVLASIRVTAQLLQEEPIGHVDREQDLQDIIDAVDRGSRLSRQLMDMGVSRAATVARTSLPEEISRIAPMLRRILGADVRLVEEADDQLPSVVIDPGHVEQIVMNLVVNARDAMAHGGRVTIRCRLKPAPRDGLECVCIEVSDTGPGVPAELRRRVFEPYFTTKEDKGTGLGLTNVWTIARSYGGFVGLESEPGHGTTFSVYFPVREEDA